MWHIWMGTGRGNTLVDLQIAWLSLHAEERPHTVLNDLQIVALTATTEDLKYSENQFHKKHWNLFPFLYIVHQTNNIQARTTCPGRSSILNTSIKLWLEYYCKQMSRTLRPIFQSSNVCCLNNIKKKHHFLQINSFKFVYEYHTQHV